MQKTCSKCGEQKPLDEFQKDHRLPDGYGARCRQCKRKADTEYRNRPETQKKRRNQRQKYKEPRNFYKTNPQARQAHNRVNNAIRAGAIEKVSSFRCAKCGNKAAEYHHHNGYDEGHEFDVIALCRSCHRLAHSELV